MTDYLLLQDLKAKVPLLSANSKHKYKIRFSNFTLETDYEYEAWLTTVLYMGEFGLVSESLRDSFPDITPTQIDKFVDKFTNDHPLTQVQYSFDDIPPLASEEEPLSMDSYMFKHSIKLSLQQELELLEIVKSTQDNKYYQMLCWFANFRDRYGIYARLKKYTQTQDSELVNLFCFLHGLNPSKLQENVTYAIKFKRIISPVLLLSTVVIIYIAIAVGCIALGGDIDSNTLMVIGYILLLWPFALAFA